MMMLLKWPDGYQVPMLIVFGLRLLPRFDSLPFFISIVVCLYVFVIITVMHTSNTEMLL